MMSAEQRTEIETKIAIQKTLISINDTALDIKRVLDTINELARENGPLASVLAVATDTLVNDARDMKIHVDELTEKLDGSQFGLPSAAIADITEILRSCMDD